MIGSHRGVGLTGLVLLLLAGPEAPALDPGKRLTQLVLDSWPSERGLPQNSVHALAQTRDGFLWVGTEEGLARFDGIEFRVFNKRTTPGLNHNFIRALLEDRDGNLWIGTEGGGLSRLSKGTFTALTTKDGLSHEQVLALEEDEEGTLWVGTAAGVDRVRGGRVLPPEGGAEAIRGRVRALAKAQGGGVWIGAYGQGLLRARRGLVRPHGARTLPESDIWSIAEDLKGNLYVGTAGRGLLRQEARFTEDEDGAFVPWDSKSGLPADHIPALIVDQEGSLWIGTRTIGLVRVKQPESSRPRFEILGTKDGLPDDLVYSFARDLEGGLWIGTRSAGLARLRDGLFRNLTAREGLPSDRVTSTFVDRDGALWVGTYGGGAARVDGDRVEVLTAKELGSGLVRSFCEAPDGSLWIGADGAGVVHMVRGPGGRRRLTRYSTADGLASDRVVALALDRNGAVWIGSVTGGLTRILDGRITRYSTKEGLPNEWVTWIHETLRGELLVATNGGGLARFRDGRFTVLTTRDGLSSDRVLTIHEDASSDLYLGTSGGGLTRIRGDRMTRITAAEGLHSDVIFQILEDGRGGLAMSSNHGIFVVEKDDIEAFAEGRERRIAQVVYGTADGMPSAECNGSNQPAGTRDREGRLYFPTIRGVTSFDPARIGKNQRPPAVFIESATAEGAEEELPEAPRRAPPREARLSFRPGSERFEFRYLATSLLVPEKVRYRYFLEGFDKVWTEAGTRRVAYYTNLPHGDYTFRVTACNNDGIWNTTGAKVSFTVEPHTYQTLWFRLLVPVTLAFAAYLVHRVRIRRLSAYQHQLSLLVEEKTRSLLEAKDRTEAALKETDDARREAESRRAEAEARQSEAEALRLEAERQRAAAQEARASAEEANRAKSQFLAVMSHELRTPLNAVLGFAQLLGRDPRLHAEQKESVSTILRAGEHLLGLINDVLSLARIESGKQVVVEQAYDLPRLLKSLEAMMRGRAEAQGLSLLFELDPSLPRLVHGDDGKLRQILFNLLGNAVKFTERGQVRLVASWRDGRGIFEVEDTGPGIAPSEMANLFTPFTQTKTGLKSHEGSGLGLAISRSFAELLGGDITVQSKPGKGTVFRVEIALAVASRELHERTARESRHVASLAPGQPPFRLLVADGVLENRILLQKLLEAAGFDVRSAADGREALEVWRGFRPHLIWLDTRLPGVDGATVARLIRESEKALSGAGLTGPGASRSERVRLVALSASALESEKNELLRGGCDAFLAKPYREPAIFDILSAQLGVRYVYDEAHGPGSGASARAPSSSSARPVSPGLDEVGREDPEETGGLALDLSRRPREELQALRLAVARGDAEEALRVASGLSRGGARVAQLIRAYRFEELEAILEDALSRDQIAIAGSAR